MNHNFAHNLGMRIPPSLGKGRKKGISFERIPLAKIILSKEILILTFLSVLLSLFKHGMTGKKGQISIFRRKCVLSCNSKMHSSATYQYYQMCYFDKSVDFKLQTTYHSLFLSYFQDLEKTQNRWNKVMHETQRRTIPEIKGCTYVSEISMLAPWGT